MTWIALASMLLGLACVPWLDPVSSRYLRAVGRARRVRRLRARPRRINPRTIIPPRSPTGVTLPRRVWGVPIEGYRPAPSALPRSKPPQVSWIPRRPYIDWETRDTAVESNLAQWDHDQRYPRTPAAKPVSGTREG